VSVDRVDSFTKAGLPAAGVSGRLARVTDAVRGLWLDQGTQWIALAGEVVNVKEFGATGDGVTDDTTALQAAINAAQAVGATVLLPPGTYKITASLTLPGDNTHLRGMGQASVIQASLGAALIMTGPAAPTRIHRCSIRDLWLNNTNRATAGGIGLDLQRCNRSLIENVRISNVETGIAITGDAFYNDILHCEIDTVGTGVVMESGANENRLWGGQIVDSTTGVQIGNVTNPQIYGTSIELFTTGIYLGFNPSTVAVKVIGCRLESGTTGINVSANVTGGLVAGTYTTAVTTPINLVGGAQLAIVADYQANGGIVPGAISGTPTKNALYREAVPKVWVDFSTTTSTTIRDSFGVAALTDNGVGDTTITFTNAFANANYALATCGQGARVIISESTASARTSTAVRVICIDEASGTAIDRDHNSVIIFGRQ